jgi:hypothetical protein
MGEFIGASGAARRSVGLPLVGKPSRFLRDEENGRLLRDGVATSASPTSSKRGDRRWTERERARGLFA